MSIEKKAMMDNEKVGAKVDSKWKRGKSVMNSQEKEGKNLRGKKRLMTRKADGKEKKIKKKM